MLDYLYEMKTSRRNTTLDSQRFSADEANGIFSPIKKSKTTILAKKIIVNPVEMDSVHIDLANTRNKKGLLKFFKKNGKKLS